MTHRINLRGLLIPNDYKWYYDWLEYDSTCPSDVQKVLDALQDGDDIEVYVNSPGGVIDVGSEIYTLLRTISDRVKIIITGEACSAASIVAMAAHCIMAPTALMMVHCVSTSTSGNHAEMEHTAEMLRTADEALSTAYSAKTGMSRDEVLEMMNHETWLTAEKAKEKGLVDEILFEEKKEENVPFVAGPLFSLPSEEQLNKAKSMLNQAEPDKDQLFLLQTKANFLNLKGEHR